MLTKKLIVVAILMLMFVVGNAQAGGDVANGLVLSEDCAMCHGDDGLGDEDVPAVAGLGEAKILKELTAFNTGERVDEEEDMVDSTADLSEQDIADLAAYYATLAGPEK